jgi:hydroxyethylthiazole kinase-like uncharacterized protein yjeF
MSMKVVTAIEMQAMDRETIEAFGIPGRVLMENAGRGATRSFLERIYRNASGRIGIIAGRGNNGGDGFVMARYLAQRGLPVTVYLLAMRDKVQGDAAANLDLLDGLDVTVVELPDPGAFQRQGTDMRHIGSWIDAILGTGLNSDVKGYFKEAIEFVNRRQRPVFAVDIPSGLNSDSGHPCGTSIEAHATATFGFPKIGHLVYPGARLCGTVDVIDIGIPPVIAATVDPKQQLITATDVQAVLGQRQPDMHKGGAGHVLVVAGSTGKTGAAAMTATSAMRSGAGLVTLGIPRSLNPILEAQVIEAMTVPLVDNGHGYLGPESFDTILEHSNGKACLAIGPGLGTASATTELVHRIITEIDLPVVVDADGLNHLAADMSVLKKRTQPVVLTPHPGEMARLIYGDTASVQADRIGTARRLATQYGCLVVLKGARTIIADGNGRAWINPTGNAGMAAGGMGDVLTGMIAGLSAQGKAPLASAIAAAYLHGLAADILMQKGPYGYLATEVMHAIPQAIRKVIEEPPEGIVNCPLL